MLTECVYPRKCIGALRPLRTLISVPKALVLLMDHLYPSVFISSDDMVIFFFQLLSSHRFSSCERQVAVVLWFRALL